MARSAPSGITLRFSGGPLADGPRQPIARPPSQTHIAHVCGSGTIKNFINAKVRLGLA